MQTHFIKQLEKQSLKRCTCNDLFTRYETDEFGEKYSYTVCRSCSKRISTISYSANETLINQEDNPQDNCNANDYYSNYSRPRVKRKYYKTRKRESHYLTPRATHIEFLGNFSDEVKALVSRHKDKLTIDVTISIRDFYNIVGPV